MRLVLASYSNFTATCLARLVFAHGCKPVAFHLRFSLGLACFLSETTSRKFFTSSVAARVLACPVFCNRPENHRATPPSTLSLALRSRCLLKMSLFLVLAWFVGCASHPSPLLLRSHAILCLPFFSLKGIGSKNSLSEPRVIVSSLGAFSGPTFVKEPSRFGCTSMRARFGFKR